ncbi:MAG: hypothetical protein H7Y30_14940 [Pyrinomonadaceae bacterium]|nr:hypothetical protein [Pyrinomonadaceae bacterium]
MYSKTRRNMLLAIAVMMAFVLACNSGLEEANKLVAEGNVAIQEGNKLALEAGPKHDRLFAEAKAESFEEDKERLKGTAKEAVDGLTKGAEKYREASKKFDEASKLKVDDKFKEYLTLKSQEFAKRAEQVDLAKGNAQAFLDSSDPVSLMAKVNANQPRVEALEKESKDLETKADKIRTENKDKIK